MTQAKSIYQVPKEYPVDAEGNRLYTKDGKQVRTTGEQVVRAAVLAAWPDRSNDIGQSGWRGQIDLDGVTIQPVAKAWGYTKPKRPIGVPLGGIELRVSIPWQLRPRRGRKNDPMRRVMVSVEGTLDLDALRTKHEELRKEAVEMEARAKAKDERRLKTDDQLKATRERMGLSWHTPVKAFAQEGGKVYFKTELDFLTEEQAVAIIAFLKEQQLWEGDE